jgi:hypothetical protein
MPELPGTIAVVRVRCNLPGPTAPLERACRHIERMLDGYRSPRHELLDEPARSLAERFLLACNRLAAQAPGHAVLVLEGIETADAATHRFLAQLLREPAKLRLPLLLVVREQPPETFRAIVDALEHPVPLATPMSTTPATTPRPARETRDVFGSTREHLAERFEEVARLVRAGDMNKARGELTATLHAIADLGVATDTSKTKELAERLDAVARLVRAGEMKKAGEELGATLDAISTLPPGMHTATLAARALLERARVRWLGAGVDPTFTLDGALEAALEARTALGDTAPPRLRADIAAVVAGIAYDIGDGASVTRAAEVVTESIAALLNAGATTEAAMLLNEQAALELRIGRGTKARDLALRSLALLTARVKEAPTDGAARADLAATHHLLARLPLHGATEASTPEAVATALGHAADAEAAYRALGMKRDVGRAIETRARLEVKANKATAAHAAFEVALRIADECADLTGLARVTAGLAELLAGAGKARDALGLLASSIELNREKASPVGLAFDERALARIEDAIFALPERDAELATELKRTRDRLTRAMGLESAR